MSAHQHTIGQDSVPENDQSQFCHPKAERAKAKKARGRLENHGPVYPSKNQFQRLIADNATLGDKGAHTNDSYKLCPKLLPADRQESRGCKTRDMDKRTKRWNKEVYLGSFPEEGVYAGE